MQWESGKKRVNGVVLRKKIKQLAYGVFDCDEPDISLSVERIELEAVEGKDVSGEFSICSSNGKKLRGIVYSTYPRMECLTPQFDGEEIRVRYQFHSDGLVEGDVRKGEFVIVCDRGEYNLSFAVSVSKAYANTSVGKMKTLDDFVCLARESMEEAYQFFYSVSFSYILKNAGEKERLLYEAIRKEAPAMQAVEAYLTGIGRKPPVIVELEQQKYSFMGITASQKEQIWLVKDNWGYVSCDVKCDGAFIQLSKERIESEDFLGSTCFFDFYVDADKLHAGRNYGRIIFEFPKESRVCEIVASSSGEERNASVSGHLEYLKYKTDLMQCYIDYRTKKIVTGVWAGRSIEILDHLSDAEPDNDLYDLMKAQAYIVNRQRQEASWILEDYKRKSMNRNTPEWGYYLYLCTLMEREETYVNRLAGQMEELFSLHPDSSLLFWVLLFVREEYYENSARRLKAIESWVEKGNDSPFFYLEAFYLYWQDTYLLTRLGTFEIKVLNWARKYQTISKEIAMQVIALLPTVRSYDEKVYHILEACYEVADNEETVAAICSYLIKGQKFTKEYHKWYALGVEYEVRITNLYEAYLLSVDKDSMEQVPKVIFMYFQYYNTLSYKQLALLYSYIIRNKDKYKKIYQNYRRTMEQFAMSQIEAGHMDENLAVIYKEMLPFGILNEELAEKFANVLFVHKLRVTEEKKFAKAVIVQKQYKHRQVVSVVDGTAYFKAFTDDYYVLLQDAKGQIFAEKRFYEEEALLEADIYIEMVMKLAPVTVPYLIYSFDKKQKESRFGESDEAAFAVLMDSPDVSEEWKACIQPAFVRHFMVKDFGSMTEQCLKSANYSLMSVEDRRFMIEQLIENHAFEEAYEMLQLYGYDTIGSAYRVTVCSYKIMETHYEEDEFLLGFAGDTFGLGKYNDVILSYLCRYYNGPTKYMLHVWKSAKEFDIDTFDMEERIITQMLYSTEYVESVDDVYTEYCKKGGRDLICMAYLSYFAHLYLVKDAVVSEQVFLQMEHRILLHQEVADVHNYALLKYYAELDTLTDGQYKIADALMSECTCNNIYFAFYKNLDERLVTKYYLDDKYFVEYHTTPGTRVGISYYHNGEKLHEEEMTEVYDGIFVKSFILFFGDKLSYYITESNELKGRSTTSSGQLEKHDVNASETHGRYAMLNDMFLHVTLQEADEVKCAMKEYSEKRISTEKIFGLL